MQRMGLGQASLRVDCKLAYTFSTVYPRGPAVLTTGVDRSVDGVTSVPLMRYLSERQ